ncbi:putative reverse transcriptase domain-containing protein [Tanacetum coccineum]
MSHSYSNNAHIESYEGVSHEMMLHKSFDNVTATHQEGIMVLPQPQEKSSKPASTGQVSSAMHIDCAEVAMPINESATSPLGMKHLKTIDYVSKWVEAQAFPASDARNIVNFLKRLFARFGIPKALISDRGTHFCNYQMEKVMKRLFPGKLKLRWYGPFSVSKDIKNGAIELYDEDGNEFIVNKQRVKPYQKDVLDTNRDGYHTGR